jgi:membrane-bound metal-dependent hydrolase YbcI (DUF457 family)
MPSTVGHALAGVAVVWVADLVPGRRTGRTAPPGASWYRRAGDGLTAAGVGLAVVPDADLLFGMHRNYSHSVGAVILVGLAAATVAVLGRRPVARVSLTCAAAYGSHLALDWMAVDAAVPYGIQALWPFSDAWMISGWNLFRQVQRHRFLSMAAIVINAKAVAYEVATLLPVVVALWSIRVKALAGLASEVSRGDHSPQ